MILFFRLKMELLKVPTKVTCSNTRWATKLSHASPLSSPYISHLLPTHPIQEPCTLHQQPIKGLQNSPLGASKQPIELSTSCLAHAAPAQPLMRGSHQLHSNPQGRSCIHLQHSKIPLMRSSQPPATRHPSLLLPVACT